MESLRKRVNVELVNNEKRIKKALAKPTVKNFTIVNEDLVMVQFAPKKILLNKPMYTGFVVFVGAVQSPHVRISLQTCM